jgi:hypothetical protein
MDETREAADAARGAGHGRQLPPEIEAMIAGLADGDSKTEAARLLALVCNRAVSLVHKVARDEAARTKGTPEWATWAKLVNASRNAVLAASMCREVATDLAQRASSEKDG